MISDSEARMEALTTQLSLLATSAELDPGQQELARTWRDRVQSAHADVARPVVVPFLAEVGRGKSSLIAAATGLRLGRQGTPKKWSVLPVGDGRTTLGETRIEAHVHDDIRLSVEPIAEAELRTELRLFARDLWKRNHDEERASVIGQVGEELHGLLRAWLVPKDEDRRAVLDEIAQGSPDPDALEQTLIARIDLEQRSSAFERLFTHNEDGLRALRSTLRALMRGEQEGAPAPNVIRLRLPPSQLSEDTDVIIDTRGIDSGAPTALIKGRSDLHELMSNVDVVPIVCSAFGNAPDVVTLELLREFTSSRSGLEQRTRPWRVVIIDDRELDDESSEQRRQERERAERVEQCRNRLKREGIEVPDEYVVAIDARVDDELLQQTIAQLAREHRAQRVQRWQDTMRNASEASAGIRDVDLAARARGLDLRLWWAWDAAMAGTTTPSVEGMQILAHLIAAGELVDHWSHVYATSRRRGRYQRLDLALLGADQAMLAQGGPLGQVLGRFSELSEQAMGLELRSFAHHAGRIDQFGQQWANFDAVTRRRWRDAFTTYFDSPQADELWSWCEDRWGQGSGYIQEVADRFRQESERASIRVEPPLSMLEDALPPRPELLRVQEIELRNFRGIIERSIQLSETTTVLVGDNGLGKTGWLEAIAAGMSVLLSGLVDHSFDQLANSDVRQVIRELGEVPDRQPQVPVTLRVQATIEGRALAWSLQKDSLDDGTEVVDGEGIRIIAREMDADVRAHSDRQLPVLAYYGTQRLWPTIEANGARREIGNRLDGYRDCLKAASTHASMQDWVRHYTLVGLQRGKPVPQLRAIKRAVVGCISEAEDFHYDLALEDFVLTMGDGTFHSFRLLSDGYRNIVAMVADIAWRASVLNPQLGERAPALAEGIVLVDEIDLHLHPRWQRRVLADLRRAFPRLQIITTTHSPFIVQSLEPGQLVNLDETAEDVAYANESPEDIAEHVMGVEVPQRSERRRREYEVAKRYYDLLEQLPEGDDAKVQALKAELDDLLAPHADNQALVAFLERKRDLAEARRQ